MHTANCLFTFFLIVTSCLAKSLESPLECRQEKHRPQLHWSVFRDWANDPNGMVYYEGEFHLYFQYTPGSTQSGIKYWGHSVSTDLMTWTDLQVAIEPDDLGAIWSGSAVMDLKNSSGFQQEPTTPPMIAFFTHAGATQQQSIAYSLNRGRDFTKYQGNPVIPNPGNSPDFRDPKVIAYDDSTWILVLAAGHHVSFYGSSNLREWELLSHFGEEPPQGAHDSVWECPELLRVPVENGNGDFKWVLTISLGAGHPNGGSGTQYFVGDFDGRAFSSNQVDPLWVETGKDNYAGVTFSNEPNGRQISIGWMTNLAYAGEIPTGDYRGAMTLPRAFTLANVSPSGSPPVWRLRSSLVDEFSKLRLPEESFQLEVGREIGPNSVWRVSEELNFFNPLNELNLSFNITGMRGISSIAICFLNVGGQELCVGYDHVMERNKKIFLNRERTGNLGQISGSFTGRPTAGREIEDGILSFGIVMDWSAVELFVDGGLTTMTAMFFPDQLLNTIEIRHHAASGSADSRLVLVEGKVQGLRSMYDC